MLLCMSNVLFGHLLSSGWIPGILSHGEDAIGSFSIYNCQRYKDFTCSGPVYVLISQLKCFLQDLCSLNLDTTLNVVQACVSYFFQLPCHIPGLVGLWRLTILVSRQWNLCKALATSLLESKFVSCSSLCLRPTPKALFYIQ